MSLHRVSLRSYHVAHVRIVVFVREQVTRSSSYVSAQHGIIRCDMIIMMRSRSAQSTNERTTPPSLCTTMVVNSHYRRTRFNELMAITTAAGSAARSYLKQSRNGLLTACIPLCRSCITSLVTSECIQMTRWSVAASRQCDGNGTS